jgi:hypothetical protein
LADQQIRYLVHYSDGDSGMRFFDQPIAVGAEVPDGGNRYRVDRVEAKPNPSAFGRAWAHDWRTGSARPARPTTVPGATAHR